MEDSSLLRLAIQAREKSYSPYSGFMVGAALLTKEGRVYQGCNIENAAFTPGNCAERTAFFKAVSEGETEFIKIAVVGWAKNSQSQKLHYTYPCGVCRQVMMEFCDPSTFTVIVGTDEKDYTALTLAELLPNGFGPSDLK